MSSTSDPSVSIIPQGCARRAGGGEMGTYGGPTMEIGEGGDMSPDCLQTPPGPLRLAGLNPPGSESIKS